MKIKELKIDSPTIIYLVTNESFDDKWEWQIIPTDYEFIPEEEWLFIVKAKEVDKNQMLDCFIWINTPERIIDFVVKKNFFGKMKIVDLGMKTVIPAVASKCFWNYEIYYSKEYPDIWINILKAGLESSDWNPVIAEDLWYILRDEGRVQESIDAFLMSEKSWPSSDFIYQELSNLYNQIWDTVKSNDYKNKFSKIY